MLRDTIWESDCGARKGKEEEGGDLGVHPRRLFPDTWTWPWEFRREVRKKRNEDVLKVLWFCSERLG
jgi:hypothetical protein